MRALILLIALMPVTAHAACGGIDDFLLEIECLQDEYARVDGELNRIWPKVLADPPSGGDQDAQRQRIRQSQRAWITFRDADCAALETVGIAKYWEYNRLHCVIDHTQSRIRALTEAYVN